MLLTKGIARVNEKGIFDFFKVFVYNGRDTRQKYLLFKLNVRN